MRIQLCALTVWRKLDASSFGTSGVSGTARAVRFPLGTTSKNRRARALPLTKSTSFRVEQGGIWIKPAGPRPKRPMAFHTG
ncbi:hypothetical protein TBK1r_22710 [Stieleria magnilauensis]|uniref:Uncharacterized protein n=1 Tax=Stieleria magnilauensis TaxID=2527963 RepID=A0ABX5XMY6_9BACT|nr:hypothetical protein TBK1r_22710 [Planctomycetes bacterium TBK1r]